MPARRCLRVSCRSLPPINNQADQTLLCVYEHLHPRGYSPASQFIPEDLMHARILVFVFDLIATILYVVVDASIDLPHVLRIGITYTAMPDGKISASLV